MSTRLTRDFMSQSACMPAVQRRYGEFLEAPTSELLEVMVSTARQWILPGFVIDDNNRYAIEQILYWLLADHKMTAISPRESKIVQGDPTKGIFLYGPTGSGKSILMRLMITQAICSGVSVRLCGEPYGFRATKLFRSTAITDAYRRGDEDTINLCRLAPMLCIDDLGAEPLECLYMGNRLNVLSDIIEERGDRFGQLTFITSNLPLYAPGEQPSVHKLYGTRVSSRLEMMCNFIPLYGVDRRTMQSRTPRGCVN